MFQALIQKAEGAVGSAVNKVASRAAVAVPLVIAAGFGIAALTVTQRAELASRLRSAVSPWVERRSVFDKVRDRLEVRAGSSVVA